MCSALKRPQDEGQALPQMLQGFCETCFSLSLCFSPCGLSSMPVSEHYDFYLLSPLVEAIVQLMQLGQIFRFNNHLRMSFFFLAFSFGIIFFIDLCSVLIKSSKYISPISIVEPKRERDFYNISLGP